MTTKNLILRVDSGEGIGAGHIVRSLALSQPFIKAGFEVYLFMRDIKGALFDFLPKNIHIKIISNISIDEEIKTINNFLKKLPGLKIALLDHYNLDHNYQQELNSDFKITIDDFTKRQHKVDIYINPNLGIIEEEISFRRNYQRLLTGASFCPIRLDFLSKRPLSPKNLQEVKKILVFFGLNDDLALIPKFFEGIGLNKIEKYKFIIPTNLESNTYKYIIETNRNLRNHIQALAITKDFASVLSQVDFVIGASGSSCWERACLAIPSAIINVSSNQDRITKEILKRRWALYLGNRSIDLTLLDNLFSRDLLNPDLLNEISHKSFNGIDGHGAERIFTNVMEVINAR